MTADELAAAVSGEAANELASALGRIKHCLGPLTDEQVWWRSRPSLNTTGKLYHYATRPTVPGEHELARHLQS